MDPNPNSTRVDRKTIEKNRRNQMKSLYSTLNALVPHRSPREVASISDQLEGATDHIKKLQTNIEKMKEKKKCLTANSSTNDNINNKGPMIIMRSNSGSTSSGPNNSPSINIDVRVMGSALEVVITSGPTCQLVFSEILRILHEEAAEVVTATFTVLQDMVFHTIHCKISGDECSIKHGAARISERLRNYVCHIS